jgi:hypothetical protein
MAITPITKIKVQTIATTKYHAMTTHTTSFNNVLNKNPMNDPSAALSA